jgi:hypothetical protein
MQPIKNVRLATQGIAAVLLFGSVFAAVGAEQMRALPRTAPASAVNAVPAPAKSNAVLAPALTPVPNIVIGGGGITIGGKLVPFNSATPVSVSSSSCNIPFQFPLKNTGSKVLGFTISMKMKSEQNQSSVLDMNLGGLSLAPDASYMETHNGSGLNLVSGTTYNFTVDTDFEHNMRKDVSRGHIYSVRFTPNCGSTPPLTPGTPGTTPTPVQRTPGQSMGGGLRMGSALTPGSQPSVQPPQGRGAEKHSTLAPAQPSQGGGVAMLNPDVACANNSTPRISTINGKKFATLLQSGILFQPGSKLDIAGCGFGPGGQAYLNAGDRTVPLKIDSWKDSHVVAKIDDALGGVPDFGMLTVYVKPNSAPVITLAGPSSFRAARETIQIALPPARGVYSKVYGTPKTNVSPDGKFTKVERKSRFTPYCPTQPEFMDIWPIDSGFFNQGFEVVSVDYKNWTNQVVGEDINSQFGVSEYSGRAQYEASKKRIAVMFQGHSTYQKKGVGVASDFDGSSECTSLYFVSLTVTGPRGVAPFK